MFTNLNKYKKHSYFMSLALQQAHKSLGNTGPNPAVGCVITKNNHVISAGFTSFNGRPHAEYNAINLSKENLKNSELYVTLEPCSHYGKTSPCVKTIVKKKISRVFFSIKDPDLRSYDKSTKYFKKKKIMVRHGILSFNVRDFYKSYSKSKKGDLPFVTSKIAISKDFYTVNKKKRWITNEYSRGRVHLMRSCHDCIITGVNTILLDNPKLTCRINGLEKNSPSRVILDKELRIPITSNIVRSASKHTTIVFFNKANRSKIKILRSLKVKLFKIPLTKDKNFDLKNILIRIKTLGFSRIFLESGINLTSNFLNEGLVDVLQLFVSGKNLGNNGNSSFRKYMRFFLKKKKFTKEKVNLFSDKLITYQIK